MSDSGDEGHMVPSGGRYLQRNVGRKEQLKLKAADRGIDIAADAITLLIEGGRVFVERERIQTEVAKGWEETHQRIAAMDAETRNILLRLEGEMAMARDRTERLNAVLATISRLGNEMPDTLARGFEKALHNLTMAV